MTVAAAVPSCSNCKHVREQAMTADNFGTVRPLECWRFPPTAHLVNTPNGPGVMPVHPVVQPLQTCGEFAPILAVMS